ncbi:MAG: hypothetical protein JWO83_1337 [Caulobacteraceae bacterium]|nr:hypothetical protein [Caulobacteraceae bacterium]
MTVLQRLKLALTCIFWLFTVLFGYAVGRAAEEFDWPSFLAIMGMSGASYAVVAAIWWRSGAFRRDHQVDSAGRDLCGYMDPVHGHVDIRAGD